MTPHRIRTELIAAVAAWAAVVLAMPAHPAAAQELSEIYDGLEWRFVGPYRGGRVTAVTGVVGDPMTYYMGATGGGVWKTTNAGLSWTNLSDQDFGVGTIGAIAVAPSDSNVIYVGTGESPIRGVTTSHGDGVYKSTDAGMSWRHIGLADTRQISAVIVHPEDPDTVWIAAQGNPWGANDERGVYKTTDGGRNWRQVLSVDGQTGAADLVADPTNPRILYAAMWTHGRTPWFIRSGGEQGGIFKSDDGGETWNRLSGGLPELVGKIGLAVAAQNPARVYAIIEAEDGGLYRSEDGGRNWTRVNGGRLIQARPWYYNHIAVDPTDDDTVYIMNAPLLKSVDGGKSFAPLDAPHGDHHDMWFNPANGDNFINGNDGGATVTFDGGKTWSSIFNQPTAQFYRVITDNLTPYTIYGGQQDNTTLAIRSDAYDGRIGRDDYTAVGGGESAHIAFDPDNPRLIYATTINATLTEYDTRLRRIKPIKPYPEYVFGRNPREHKYRTNWNAPVIVSPHDPEIIYYGTQVLLKSADRGLTWTEISPDLTKNDPEKQGLNGGPITNEQAGAEFYNTIFYIAESPHEAGTIWVGSDDGLVHLTRDGGANWSDVTPRGVGEAHINSIEISPHDPATAFIAVTGYKMNDFSPYIYATTNYGRSWDRIDSGLPRDTFVRVVRQDPQDPDLLYAGTEAGMFVSFDRGRNWQGLGHNLPPVPVTDLTIRHNDLVAATQGRGFWVLDDLSVLQQIEDDIAGRAAHLFTPAPGVRLAGRDDNARGGDPSTEAAPRGVLIRYYLGEEAAEAGALRIEIRDSDGATVRRFSGEETESDACAVANADPRNPLKLTHPTAKAGLNQWVWDLRAEPLNCIPDLRLFAGFDGPHVTPGRYSALLQIGEASATAPLTVIADPRLPADAAAFAELDAYLDRTVAMMNDLTARLDRARRTRTQIRAQLELNADHAAAAALAIAGRTAIDQITAWEEQVTQPRHETFEDDINWPNMLDVQIRHLIDALDQAYIPVTAGAKARFEDLADQWQARRAELAAIAEGPVADFNALLADHAILPVPAP